MSVKQVEHDFGEATVTSKGQVTVPISTRRSTKLSRSPWTSATEEAAADDRPCIPGRGLLACRVTRPLT